MDTQDLLALAAKAFQNGAGSSAQGLDMSAIVSALSGLLGGENGQINLAGLLSQLQAGGLADLAATWLGSGQNGGIDASQILGLFGQDKVAGFAETLGLPEGDAVSGLQSALPELMDQASPNGSLVESLDVGAAAGLLKGLFK